MSTEPRVARGLLRSRGFALLIVLWAIALAALIGAQITSLGRRETLIAGNLRAAAIAEAAADGAVYQAIFRLLRNENGWDADGSRHTIVIGQVSVVVTIVSENGKIDLNKATPDTLAALMVAVGIDDAQARMLANAIVAWRSDDRNPASVAESRQRYRAAGLDYAPPFQPFETVGELSLVLGIAPNLYARLAPHLTVYGTDFDPAAADPVVAQVLGAPANANTNQRAATGARGSAVTIDAHATGSGGAAFDRHAVVRLAGRDGYAVLIWDRGGGR